MAIYDVMKMLKSPVSTVCIDWQLPWIYTAFGEIERKAIYLPPWCGMIHQPSLGGYIQGVMRIWRSGQTNQAG
jgi:ATP-dependent Clp protease protease subunit